jgi:uncharacterized protein
MHTSVIESVIGGALIGLGSAVALVVHGRIAGISGIVANSFRRDGREFRVGFLLGLLGIGALLAALWPHAVGASVSPWWLTVPAGLIVGFGAGASNGCTSGHGVCGIGRGSPRSLVAVPVFMITAAITVAVVASLRGAV